MTNKKQLDKKISDYRNQITQFEQEILKITLALENNTITDQLRNDLKLDLTTKNAMLATANAELAKLETILEINYTNKQLKTEQNVVKALNDFNAYYISSERKWYCIYSEHNRRHQPKVTVVDSITMRDMIYGATQWQTDNDWDLKKIALDNKRYYRDVERTFLPSSPNTLNQMTELRKFWLKPIYDCTHHIAFDILFYNLVGGQKDYMDQIEKYIAYSYVKPEDIFAPNIDSSARGGVGRDTVFRILEIIFTEECCGEAKKETVQGTHNGELWGKVWVKISESNNRLMDINELKNLTGGHNFRLRRMGENAVQVPRTFRFMMMSNNYEGTARLTGSGSDAEDRRWEPIFSQTSLLQRVSDYLNVPLNDPKVGETLQDWQQNVFQNETEIAKWLGYIIQKHKPETIAKLKPLHGEYYNQMIERQKNSMSIFMENVINLQNNTNCYDVDIMYKIFKIVHNTTMTKNQFAKRLCEWLMGQFPNTEFDIKLRNIYRPTVGDNNLFSEEVRVKRQVVSIKEQKSAGRPKSDEEDTRLVFDITDFIDLDRVDDKGKELGCKPHPNNIKEELF